MVIIEDTRQKPGKHENKTRYWAETGTECVRYALPFGDYWTAPTVAVDTKQDIQEIGANMCGASKEKARFREECKKAQAAGCKLIFLIEDDRFSEIPDLFGKKIWLHNGQTIPGDQLAMAMYTMQNRYGVEFLFTPAGESGRVIKELLEDG